MSRYVDLDGVSWDGKPIFSKIQEVKTKSGYMNAITTGWLYCEDVPHIDLAEHDAEVRKQTIDELVEKFKSYICTDVKQTYFYTEFLCEMQKIAEQMKGETE